MGWRALNRGDQQGVTSDPIPPLCRWQGSQGEQEVEQEGAKPDQQRNPAAQEGPLLDQIDAAAGRKKHQEDENPRQSSRRAAGGDPWRDDPAWLERRVSINGRMRAGL